MNTEYKNYNYIKSPYLMIHKDMHNTIANYLGYHLCTINQKKKIY